MLTDAVWFWKIVAAIGRLLTDYNNLEISLLHCVQKGIGDFDCAFKKMFGERGETNRMNSAERLALGAYRALGLDGDFALAIDAIRHALKIRNQYVHWTWWDDNSGYLAIANLEGLAKDPKPVAGLDELSVYHIDLSLIEQQQRFFLYVDRCLLWVNFQGRLLTGEFKTHTYPRPTAVEKPALYIP